jgi:hypothetical protein
MQVRLTEIMLAALREASEMPDNLLARVNAARAEAKGFVVTLSDDEAMAMTEMCQWYVRKDPATGELGVKARLFDGIVNAIYEAESG